MEKRELRRGSKRYPARWKVAVVFDKADDRPVLHTQTQDLSIGGASVYSAYDDLTGTTVTLFVAHPPRRAGEVPPMLKIRARVVSTVQSPGKQLFRHGLSFVRSPDDGLDILAGFLGAGDPSSATAEPSAASAPAATGRLAQLKQLAMAKQAEEKKPDPQAESNARVGAALERAYRYLKELTEQLNIVKPNFPKGYSIVGVPSFDGLAWAEGRVDLRVRETPSQKKQYEQIALYFKLSGNKQLRVTRENPAHEKLKQQLLDSDIEFTTRETRNDRGFAASVTFEFPCEVKASLQLRGDLETGKLLLKARNVARFGLLEYVLAPEAVTEQSLDELSGFILGESSRIGPLLLIGA